MGGISLCTHTPLSSSFLGLLYRKLNISHKKNYLGTLWVVTNFPEGAICPVQIALLQAVPGGLGFRVWGCLGFKGLGFGHPRHSKGSPRAAVLQKPNRYCACLCHGRGRCWDGCLGQEAKPGRLRGPGLKCPQAGLAVR